MRMIDERTGGPHRGRRGAARATAALVGAAVLATVRPPGATGADGTELALSMWVAPSHPIAEAMQQWSADVEAGTEGRVRVRWLPKPVVSPPATYDAIRDGLADVSFTLHGYTPGRFALTSLAEWPLLGDSAETTSVAWQRVHDRHLAAADEHRGVKVLAVFTHGPGMILNNRRPVLEAGDLRGLKFRVGGGVAMALGKALGADVTLRPANEVHTLLASGVMDGAFFPPEAIPLFRLEKLIEHVTQVPGGFFNSSFVVLMNLERWQHLSPADRAVIDRISGERLARAIGRATDRRAREALDDLAARGARVHVASPALVADLQAHARVFDAQWQAAARARGIADPARVVADFSGELARR